MKNYIFCVVCNAYEYMYPSIVKHLWLFVKFERGDFK